MVEIFSAIAAFAAEIVGKLGASGTAFLVLGMLLLLVGLLVGRAVLRTLLLCMKAWRRLPTWGKQVVGIFGLVFAYKFMWPFIPKTEAVLAVCSGFVMFYWWSGWNLSKRYGIDGGYLMIAPWVHYAEITSIQRGITSAVEGATGKKHGKARRPTITPEGFLDPIEPPDGMSADELADAINNGTLAPSLARAIGWDKVHGTFAEARDNLVHLYVSATKSDGHDPLADVHRWPGMEMQP